VHNNFLKKKTIFPTIKVVSKVASKLASCSLAQLKDLSACDGLGACFFRLSVENWGASGAEGGAGGAGAAGRRRGRKGRGEEREGGKR